MSNAPRYLLQGYLAAITTPEENNFILSSYPNMHFWIGGTDNYGLLFLSLIKIVFRS